MKEIKYSIIMPYFRRVPLLNNTLVSYQHHYHNRDDWEVIVAEDAKNLDYPGEHENLKILLDKFKDKMNVVDFVTKVKVSNPAPYFNEAFSISKGEFIILTNPECVHISDILKGLDDGFSKDKNSYIVCACLHVTSEGPVNKFEDYKFQGGHWYQHSVHRNGLIHFCSAISSENYKKLGGFDEEFAHGVSCEDVDFQKRVALSDMNVVTRDDLLTHHQKHEIVNVTREHGKLHKRNWDLCVKKGWYEKSI